MTLSSDCTLVGGCPTDYVAFGISILTMVVILCGTVSACTVSDAPRIKLNQFHLSVIQSIASINFLLALVMSVNLFQFSRKPFWQSCYIWGVWMEGPCGFALLLSCRIAQAYQLYYLFVKRRLPPMKSYHLIPLILLPWFAIAVAIQVKRALKCPSETGVEWVVLITSQHMSYILGLVGVTWTVQHIEFKFNEFKELVKGVTISLTVQGIWIGLYIANEIKHGKNPWIRVATRFVFLISGNVLVLVFFSTSMPPALFSKLRMRKWESDVIGTMGQLLGVADSGLVFPKGMPLNLDEPLEKLLQDKRFRQSFMAFADSRLAGEGVHFYDEVHELNRIPVEETTWRVYMAGHIIKQYIAVGSPLEINISHQMRQEILNTTDLTHPDLFKHAFNEMLQMMRMNLEKDYWCSPFYLQFEEEIKAEAEAEASELMECKEGWDHSPELSSAHCADDPFHEDSFYRTSENRSSLPSNQRSIDYDENPRLAKLSNPIFCLDQDALQQPPFEQRKEV